MKKHILLVGVAVQILVVVLARLIFITCISPYELGQLDIAYSLSIAAPCLVMFCVLIIGMDKSKLKLGLFVVFSLFTSFFNTITIQGFFPSRITTAEKIALHTLREHLYKAQLQYQADCIMDRDKNNIGEYGFLTQLDKQLDFIAEQSNRTDEHGNWVPPLTTGLRKRADKNGSLASRGYRYQIYLPDSQFGMRTIQHFPNYSDINNWASDYEKYFLIIAWPEKVNETGRHIYAITQEGKVITTNQQAARNRFIETPGWQHIYSGKGKTFTEIYNKGLDTAWTYLKDKK